MRGQVFFTNLVNLDRQPNTSENTWVIAAVRTQILLSYFLDADKINYLQEISEALGTGQGIVKLQHQLCGLKELTKDRYPDVYDRVFDDKTADMKPIEII